MSDSAFNYFNRLDSLDLSDLEILSDKITTLIFKKKKTDSLQIEKGLCFFNKIKGSVDRKIDEKQELKKALDEKYSYSNWYKYRTWFGSKTGTVFGKRF